MSTNPDWERLGRLVKERRLRLGWAVAKCTAGRDISDTTWGKLEGGNPIDPKKLGTVATAIRWTAQSVDEILGGGDPTELGPDPGALLDGHDGTDGWPAWLENWLKAEIGSVQQALGVILARVEALEAQEQNPPA